MPRSLFVFLAVLGGFCIATQVPINSRLREAVASPVLSAAISFAIGTLAMLLMTALGVLGGVGSGWEGMRLAPAWAYLGGLCGASYVLFTILAIPKLGAALTVASAVFGQQVAALLVDSLGLFGVVRVPLTLTRLAGAALVFAGVLLVQKK